MQYDFIPALLYNRFVNRFSRWIGILLVLLGLLTSTSGVAQAQEGTSKYFPETGHNVSGEFWTYYQSVPNAQTVFGYPITEAFNDVKLGRVVQYFTRARFELNPALPPGQRVQLTALGQLLYQPGPGLNFFTPIGCRSFDSGYSVCYAFLDFFDKNGGEAVFGQPISSFEFLNGRIVQYFERARFDWYPEYPEGQKVVLADLGRSYFDSVGADPNLLSPVKPSNFPGGVLSLQPRAFVLNAVVQPTDQQTVYVIVQDQTLSPVYNAFVTLTVYWAAGGPQSTTLSTNKDGVVIVPFAVQKQPPGALITVKVQVSYGSLEGETETSFRIWQ